MGPPPPKFKRVYKRFETDDEFVARLNAAPIDLHPPNFVKAKELDDYAWNNRKVQRRLVDDTA